MARVLSKSAFTLVELVVVMVVFGIVATFGVQIALRVYDNYIQTLVVSSLESQSEIALTQIAKRFQRRIIKSTSVLNPVTNSRKIPQKAHYNSDSIIEWIGVSDESLRGDWNGSYTVPGWSGFIDLKNAQTTTTSLKTLGSRLDFAQTIINALTDKDVSLHADSNNKPVLIFKNSQPFKIEDFYRQAKESKQMFLVRKTSHDTLAIVDENLMGKRAYEHYQLAHTAYALMPKEEQNKGYFTLMLYYNYQPWNGESYKDGSASIIAQRVTKFRFLQERGVVRFVLCLKGEAVDVNVCKEKVVF